MTITIAGIAFSHHHYDARGDVLYLNRGAPRSAARSHEIDGGHAVHYDESDSIIGLTLLNIRRTLETDGHLDLRLPVVHIVDADSIREAFALTSSKPEPVAPNSRKEPQLVEAANEGLKIDCADAEAETIAVERIRSGAAQRTRDGATVLAELGFDLVSSGDNKGSEARRNIPYMLTVAEAADRVGKDPETVRRWIRSGRLRAKRIGRRHAISDRDLRTVEDELFPMAELPDEWKIGDDGSSAPNWVAALHRSRRDH